MKKKTVKKKVVKRAVKKASVKKLTKAQLTKLETAVDRKLKNQLRKSKKGTGTRNERDPYAPGTWGVDYMYDDKKSEVLPRFFKLTPKEQAKNRKRILDLPRSHEETLEEIQEVLSFKLKAEPKKVIL